MSFDRFLLAVESRDLFQANNSSIRVCSFSKPSGLLFLCLNNWGLNFLQNDLAKIDALVNFIIQKFARLKSKQFSHFFWWEIYLRALRAFILQKDQALVVERQKNKLYYPSFSFGKEYTLIIFLSAWDRSRDSTTKRNLSKDM